MYRASFAGPYSVAAMRLMVLLLSLGAGIFTHDMFAAEAPAAAPPALQDAGTVPKTAVITLAEGVTMEFVLILPGTFTMGSAKRDENEWPQHQVTITKPFYLGKFEVTQEQWQAVMDSNPSNFKGPKNPVENVRWYDCRDFFENLNQKYGGPTSPVSGFRLPSKAEWEYACRAGSTTEYCFGDAESGLGEYAWYSANSNNTTHAAGGKKPNAWGLYDMHGNVSEWCLDWPGYYTAGGKAAAVTGHSDCVMLGGSWRFSAAVCRSAKGLGLGPGNHLYDLGFRIVGTRFPGMDITSSWQPIFPNPAAASPQKP